MTQKNPYLIQPIRTEADHLQALRMVSPYFDNEPEPDSDAGAHFEAMLALIDAYEAKHHAIDPPSPLEAIMFRMEQQGLKPKDLEPMIGRRNRVYAHVGWPKRRRYFAPQLDDVRTGEPEAEGGHR